MAKKDSLKKEKEKPANQSGDIHVGGSVSGSDIVIGHGNVINKYYQIIEKNTKQNDPDYWNLKHPYPMPPNFTGRLAERATLTQWLDSDSENRLFILRALGGFGKSALTWQWLTHDVNPKKWKKVVFWSFYEGDANFENFTRDTLEYLGVEVPQGGRPQVDELLKAMQRNNILFIMDGFERLLRLYASMNAAYQTHEEEFDENQLDCKDIYIEWFLKGICVNPNITSKVLITSRLTPRIIKPRGELLLGCKEIELTAMRKEDAVEFFRKQGIRGNRVEIETICELYGYHPLTLRILVGLIIHDREKPNDIESTKSLDITKDIIQNSHHVIEVSFHSLSTEQKRLLGIISCFRSSIPYSLLKTASGLPSRNRRTIKSQPEKSLGNNLQVLEAHGLLNWDRTRNKYSIHPIVRHYVHNSLDPEERKENHSRLRNYFSSFDMHAKPKTMSEMETLIEFYFHTIWTEEYEQAYFLLQKILGYLYFQFGANQLQIELCWMLFTENNYKLPKLKKNLWNAWLYNSLANSYCNIGKPDIALQLFEADIATTRENDSVEIITALNNTAIQQFYVGSLMNSVGNLNNAILLSKETSDKFSEIVGLVEISRVLSYCGLWEKSEQASSTAQISLGKLVAGATNYNSVIARRRATHFLLCNRDRKDFSNSKELALDLAKLSLKLSEERAIIHQPVEIDFVCSYWLLGAAHRINKQLDLAENYLIEALKRCRAINYVLDEADILLDLARLYYGQKKYQESKNFIDEALLITERCHYVLQGADVNLFLAQYALEQEKDKAKAKVYAEEAKKLATCDGPPYYYKVAYDEAERMLEKL